MKILHCIRKSLYEQMKNDVYFGRLLLEKNPFIHCSSIEYFWTSILLTLQMRRKKWYCWSLKQNVWMFL